MSDTVPVSGRLRQEPRDAMELLTIKVPDIFDAILDNSRLLATTARLADHPHNNAGAPAASVAAALRSTSEYEPELQRQAVQQTWSRTWIVAM